MKVTVHRAGQLKGSLAAPGDKSISHRALLFGALSEGSCEVTNLAPGADVRSTASCLRSLGVEIDDSPNGGVIVRGRGLSSLRAPAVPLDCGNSGTTTRLLSGIVAGAGLTVSLDGDQTIRRRPMKRVLEPLRQMGARATGTRNAKGDESAPLHFEGGGRLVGVRHDLKISSAQVKSCLLLAGLFADGETVVSEPSLSRDHTERMLVSYGAPLVQLPDGAWRSTRPSAPLRPPPALVVPGDPSSAAFFVGAALLVPRAEMEIRHVTLNPTRIGFLRVLERMGADVRVELEGEAAGDPVGRILVRGGRKLRGTEIAADEVPSLIDEVPLLAVVASQAEGRTTLSGAEELRVKESDRLARVCQSLRQMGARIEERPDGFVIDGPTPLNGALIDSAHDHRIAMAFAVAGLIADGETSVDGAEWADISFPGFFARLADFSGGALREEQR